LPSSSIGFSGCGARAWITPPRGNTGGSPDHSYAVNLTYFTSGSQAGMLQTAADALGDRSSYGYDAVGRKLSMVDPMNNSWQWAYDNEDRVLSLIHI